MARDISYRQIGQHAHDGGCPVAKPPCDEEDRAKGYELRRKHRHPPKDDLVDDIARVA
ncbi:hypothetical protein [Altererythrobacter aquiaggeris]|uniref:hypothetical protein n=1 Tax=Aestuarierythrobacter aquiaggeris TaxID=1898396 RepID=UPI00301B6268